ncbi:hypothetical protein GALMADRAFT_775361 [Galerina marginata CBS 339.88]|uniref:DUF6699 domain-containing protein n=1 Tax=Galerina marginata (strain CBS 339.88) TaxID=685588 RepID=A0A067SMI1_GALM3|nr:hypothetical protein GALMADRAFT_775361 [Galerina marginata CBS 339.88]
MDSSMHEKRMVRFSAQDKAHGDGDDVSEELASAWSPPPLMPSPTNSISTESSDWLSTPEDAPHIVLDSKGLLSLDSTRTPKISPSLLSSSILSWDMSREPMTVDALIAVGQDTAVSVSSVPLKRLILKNDAIPNWPLDIQAHTQDAILTNMVVFLALFDHLEQYVSGEYYTRQPLNVQKAASKAFHRRDPRRETGLRRIDFLPGRNFLGLRVKADSQLNDDGVWVLKFDVE